MRILRRLLLPLVVLVGAAILAVVVVRSRPRAVQVAHEDPGTLVDVAVVDRAPRRIDIQAQGTVLPSQKVVVQPQVGGRIAAVAAELSPGSVFAAGEMLYAIEEADYVLTIEARRAALAEAEAQLELEQGRKRVAEREWELFRDEIDAEQRQASLALREPQLRSADAKVATARAMLVQAELDLARTRVTSPFDALVLEETVELGQTVSPQSRTVTLVGTDTFWVQAAVPTDQLSAVDIPKRPGDPGSRADVSLDLGGRRVVREGQVVRLLGDVDLAGRMARLLVAVDDPLGLERDTHEPLLLDSYVHVEIDGNQSHELFELPRSWLHDGRDVWLFADGQLEIREVEVVWRFENTVLVDRGLEPGELVITSRLATPVPGMKLRRSEAEPLRFTRELESSSPFTLDSPSIPESTPIAELGR